MTDVGTTSDRLHCELVRILCLQADRETDRFSAASGVEHAQNNQQAIIFQRKLIVTRPKQCKGMKMILFLFRK